LAETGAKEGVVDRDKARSTAFSHGRVGGVVGSGLAGRRPAARPGSDRDGGRGDRRERVEHCGDLLAGGIRTAAHECVGELVDGQVEDADEDGSCAERSRVRGRGLA
jgi:hypothetical protein